MDRECVRVGGREKEEGYIEGEYVREGERQTDRDRDRDTDRARIRKKVGGVKRDRKRG